MKARKAVLEDSAPRRLFSLDFVVLIESSPPRRWSAILPECGFPCNDLLAAIAHIRPSLCFAVLQFPPMAASGPTSIRVMGIDPGLNITGYGIIERRRQGTSLIEAGVIRLPRAEGNNLPLRLESLFKGIQDVVKEFRPEVVCLEEVYSHADYPQTAVLMAHARGVICLAARLARVPVFPMPAKRIKQSVTGNGNASKLQVQRAVQQQFSLGAPPHPPDVADALAVALCYVNALRVPTNGTRPSDLRMR